MKNPDVQSLEARVADLEKVMWAVYRVLENYITFNELLAMVKKGENGNANDNS